MRKRKQNLNRSPKDGLSEKLSLGLIMTEDYVEIMNY